jgi:hypothetical protein
MKTLRSILILIAIVTITSCDNTTVNMYTHINPDGSCYREFSHSVDSAFLAGDTSKNPFPMKIDSTWRREKVESYYHVSENDGKKDSSLKHSVTLRKNYANVKDLESFRFNNTEWDSLHLKFDFRKKFRWFYTYFEFRETYPKVNPFNIIPVDSFISKEERETLYGENRNLFAGKNGLEIKSLLNTLEERADAWLNRSYYEEIYRIILKHYSDFPELPIDSTTFASAKDTIYELYKDSLNTDKFELNKALNKYFKTKAFTKIDIDEKSEEWIKKEFPDFMRYFGMDLNYILSMPGKIIETNTSIITGDTLTWKVDAYRFFFNDYTLYAKSRKPNTWAFWVTGAIIILVIASFWVKRK